MPLFNREVLVLLKATRHKRERKRVFLLLLQMMDGNNFDDLGASALPDTSEIDTNKTDDEKLIEANTQTDDMKNEVSETLETDEEKSGES